MRLPSYLLLAAALVLCAGETQAQVLALQLREGRVTLHAQDVPLKLILQEWAKAADATIVNVDQIPGGLITLHLVDVNERAALETVLRNAVGYILAERQSADGPSTFDRILIMATSGTAISGQPGQTFSGRASATPSVPAAVGLPAVVAIGTTPDEIRTSGTEAASGEAMAVVIDPPGIVSERTPERANRMVGSTFGAANRAASPTPGRSVAPNMFGVASGSAQPGMFSPAPPAPGTSPSPSEMLEEPQ